MKNLFCYLGVSPRFWFPWGGGFKKKRVSKVLRLLENAPLLLWQLLPGTGHHHTRKGKIKGLSVKILIREHLQDCWSFSFQLTLLSVFHLVYTSIPFFFFFFSSLLFLVLFYTCVLSAGSILNALEMANVLISDTRLGFDSGRYFIICPTSSL